MSATPTAETSNDRIEVIDVDAAGPLTRAEVEATEFLNEEQILRWAHFGPPKE